MKYLFIFLLVVGLLAMGTVAGVYSYLRPKEPTTRIPAPSSVRMIHSGELIGSQGNNDGHAWLGIPYAEPPVGDLRWRQPEAVGSWEGRREALEFGDRCPQKSLVEPERIEPIGNEDCLYLNVWAPPYTKEMVPKGSDRLPVMLWIHGGGNSIGWSGTSIYDGSLMSIESNVIVVSINYRLGPLGWFMHPALAGDSAADASGNYGTLDIIAALNWVQDNISAFGGDPANVTIYGESAGGVNVISMLLSPLATGLFHKAIVQSGGVFTSDSGRASNYADEGGHEFSSREVVNSLLVEENKARDSTFARSVQDGMAIDELADWLRSKSVNEVFAAYGNGFGGMLDMPAVVHDGVVIPSEVSAATFSNADNYNAVPTILGTNRDETRLFAMFGEGVTEKTFGFPTGIVDPEGYTRDTSYGSRMWKATGVDELATAMSAAQSEGVYAYRFDADDWRNLGGVDLKELLGAAHAMELFFVFGNFPRPARLIFPGSSFDAVQLLSNSMISYWGEFAHSGNPGRGRSGDEVVWLPWQNEGADTPRIMLLDTELDEGIRMSSKRLSPDEIKREFLSDSSYQSLETKCSAYSFVFRFGGHFDEQEYKGMGCSD